MYVTLYANYTLIKKIKYRKLKMFYSYENISFEKCAKEQTSLKRDIILYKYIKNAQFSW